MTIFLDRLKSIIHYDPETGILTRLKNMSNQKAGSAVGSLTLNGYLETSVDGEKVLVHRLIWFYMTGEWPTNDIDHVDAVKNNNAWSNLRLANRSENMANLKTTKGNTSGYKGVYWHKGANKWMAYITVDYKRKHLGLFEDIKDAAKAYEDAAIKYFGEFARC